MISCTRRMLDHPDPHTGRAYGWTVEHGGRRMPWQGLYTGPLTIPRPELGAICQSLLGCGVGELQRYDGLLQPARGDQARRPALILHSTTPELHTFEGDLHTLLREAPAGNFTTYKEARSVYLARPGDVVVGRTRSWARAVSALEVEAKGIEAIILPDVDHYYLSHALLRLAVAHQTTPSEAMARMVACVRATPRLVRLYAFELEMQIFLLWLARSAGREELAVEANRPALAARWNCKAVLHPTVEVARGLDASLNGQPPAHCLRRESEVCALAEEMGIAVPTVPGYTLVRAERTADDFVAQLRQAAQLLGRRHGLTTGCLKASESGDGARITPGLSLEDGGTLDRLGREAYEHGDDYVLEAHVTYGRVVVAGQELPTALSAHVRGGAVASGATLQFMAGTSWKGNLLLDEASCARLHIAAAHYRRLRRFVEDFHAAFARRDAGLVLAGIDFAVGTVGGAFGDTALLGVQDLNVSFTGAECLRAFLHKAEQAAAPPDGTSSVSNGTSYGVTRIYRPAAQADHDAFLHLTNAASRDGIFADTIASVPGCWAMVGITGRDPIDALQNLSGLQHSLRAAGLIEAP